MGRVFMAEHPGLGRKAAFKLLHKELATDPEVVSRFFNEARASNAVRHSAIVDIYDYGNLPDGAPYIVMELLEGETLTERIRRGGMTIGEAVEYGAQIASGLAATHAAAVVHRDLKPDNIFLASLREDPARRSVKILDFGIAKLQKTFRGNEHMTRTGALMGTPSYMSPEQCRGLREVDHRSDIYSLGVILYELLTGTPPFVSPGVGEMINLHINAAPQPPRGLNPGISPELEAIVLRALEKSPDDRFPGMTNLHDALRAEAAALGSRTDRGNTLRGDIPVPHPSITGPMVVRGTTLSASADMRKGTPVPPPMGSPRQMAGIVLGIVALAAVPLAVVLGRRDSSSDTPTPIPATAPRAPAAGPASPTAGIAPAPEPNVTVVFDSTPPGAAVYRDDVVIATTPGRAVVRASTEPVAFRFVLADHAEKIVRAVPGPGLSLTADLEPQPDKPAVPTALRAARDKRAGKVIRKASLPPAGNSKTAPKADLNDIKFER